MAEEFSHPRRYLPPDINIIKKFCNECHDLNILTQSMNLQANKTKQIHQAKYDAFFDEKFFMYSQNEARQLTIIEQEFKLLPPSFKTRSRDEINQQLSLLTTYKNAIINRMVQDSIRDQKTYFSSFDNIKGISDQGASYLQDVTKVRSNMAKLKIAIVDSNLKVTKAFGLQLKKKKALYILQKI